VGSKEDQIKELEEIVDKNEKEEEGLGNMVYLMNAAICYEIAKYKKQRNENYKKSI
jgi:hypothetical protein